MSSFDIALKIKVKNGVLQRFIDEKGWTQAEFARQVGSGVTDVGDWFNMKSYPKTLKKMMQIAELVGKLPEEIFPMLLRDKDWLNGERKWVVHQNVDLEQCFPLHQMAMLPLEIEDIDSFALKDEVRKALSTLTPREEMVMRMRFGIGGVGESTLEEVAKALEVSRERVRQIEQRAFRKIRHPSRNKRLLTFL